MIDKISFFYENKSIFFFKTINTILFLKYKFGHSYILMLKNKNKRSKKQNTTKRNGNMLFFYPIFLVSR